MALALLEHPHRANEKIVVRDSEPAAGCFALGGIRGTKMIAIHS